MTKVNTINEKGIHRDNYVRKEVIKAFLIGPIYSFVIIGVSYFSMSKWIAFFYFSGTFLTLLAILLFIVAPIRMLFRHNRTIKSISSDNEKVIILTFKGLWLKCKEVVIPKNKLKTKVSKLSGYGATAKEGMVFATTTGQEFYLVKDYFDEFDLIRDTLLDTTGSISGTD